MNNANALGIQTYETDVVCGMWCQGGSVKFYPTNHPQYTDIADVWVKGSDALDLVNRLRAELAACKQDAKHRITRLRDALANLHGNCYVADAPTEMIAAEEALAAEALDAARNGEGE